MSRLLETVNLGDSTAKVDPDLDWERGDRLYFAPTALQYQHSDYLTIDTYDKDSGDLQFYSTFKHYHWGEEFEPADNDFGGVDMRGEVILLNRNIQIEGEDVDGWGG
jgi:hypothetical protein